MRRATLTAGLFLCLVLVLAPGLAWADPLDEPLEAGTIEWGLTTGYGRSTALRGRRTGTDLLSFAPRIGYVFHRFGRQSSFEGSLEAIAEAPLLVAFESRTIYGGGLSTLLAYHVATGTRLVPFLEGGVGILLSAPRSSDPASPFRASQFNFSLEAGAGLRYRIEERAALRLEYRFAHFSNGGLSESNPGLDANLVLIGFSLFY